MRTRATFSTLASALLAALLCGPVPQAHASDVDIAALCDRAAFAASASEDVPYDILRAITRVETGRSVDGIFAPWPWSANAAGEGAWFDTADEALRHVEAILASGRRNVDIGCFQLNHQWHADGFASLRDMIDPERNALYAARFLQRLFAELGDWDAAVAAYHSRTPDYAERYIARYRDVRADLPDAGAPQGRAARPRVTGPSPLSLEARPSLLTRAGGLSSQGAAPLLGMRPALPLFGDRP